MNRRRLKGEISVKDCHQALHTLFGVLFSMTKVMVSNLMEWIYKSTRMQTVIGLSTISGLTFFRSKDATFNIVNI